MQKILLVIPGKPKTKVKSGWSGMLKDFVESCPNQKSEGDRLAVGARG